MGTLATVILMFVSVGVICGTVSAYRAGIPRKVIILLVILAVAL